MLKEHCKCAQSIAHNVCFAFLQYYFKIHEVTKTVLFMFIVRLDEDAAYLAWRPSYPYPQSHTRNLARKAALTDFTFLTDIDIIPSPGKAHSE